MCKATPSPNRTCVICKRGLIGRSDKVFCDIKCKNQYHIESRKTQRTAVRETNTILARNYIILKGLMGPIACKALISKLALVRAGFNFNYVTEVHEQNGEFSFWIYDLQYKYARKNNIVIENCPEKIPVSPYVFERWRRVYQPLNERLSYDRTHRPTGLSLTTHTGLPDGMNNT